MTRIKRLATLGALVALASPSSALAAGRKHGCRGAHVLPKHSNTSKVARSTLCLIDRARHRHHLQPLRANRTLWAIASGQSHDMVLGHYFGDNSISGLTPFARVLASAYGRRGNRLTVGQNIAWGTGKEATPARIVHSWMVSAPHKAILLNPQFSDAGVGVGAGAPRSGARGPAGVYTIDLAHH